MNRLMSTKRMVKWLIEFEEYLDLLGIGSVSLFVAAMMFDSGQTPQEAASMINWGLDA